MPKFKTYVALAKANAKWDNRKIRVEGEYAVLKWSLPLLGWSEFKLQCSTGIENLVLL